MHRSGSKFVLDNIPVLASTQYRLSSITENLVERRETIQPVRLVLELIG